MDYNSFKSMSILLYTWQFQTVDRVKAICYEYFFPSMLEYSCQIELLSERSLKSDESYSRIIFPLVYHSITQIFMRKICELSYYYYIHFKEVTEAQSRVK